MTTRPARPSGKPTIFVALYESTPSDSSSGTEITGGAYARQPTAVNNESVWQAASNGSTTNAVAIVFPTATASWGVVRGVALVDALTGGNIIWYGDLASQKTVDSNDQFQFAAGALTLSLD